MQKFHVLSLIGLFTSTMIFADIDDRIDDLEWEMRQVSTSTPQDSLGASFASARPEVDGEKAFITFDILYWHPKVGGTDFAYSFQPSIEQTGSILFPRANGRTKENSLSWDLGLKAGIGYNVPHDGWDIYGQYTWYQTNSTSSSSHSPPSALMPLNLFDVMLASKAKSFFNIAYQNVDISVARSYFISRMLSFRPFIGVKSTWLDLHQKVVYTASSLNDFLFPGPERTVGLDFKSKSGNHFWGIGPRIGFDSKWFLGNGFHLFSDLATALLYGYFKTSHSEFIPPDNVQFASGDIIRNRSKFHRFIPFAQMFVGLGWQGYVNHEKQHIGLKLGYEVQYFWRVNQMLYSEDFSSPAGSSPLRVQHDRPSDDVMFYGITGEFRLDF